MRQQVLIAENIASANDCAVRSLGWRRAGTGRWVDDTGSVVLYVSSFSRLLMLRPGTVVYLGKGWRETWERHYPTLKNRGLVLDEVTC